jgi:hypothetical protein
MFTVPSSTVASVVASVSGVLADPGLLGILVLVIGIPFGFWAIKQIIGLFPHSRGRR